MRLQHSALLWPDWGRCWSLHVFLDSVPDISHAPLGENHDRIGPALRFVQLGCDCALSHAEQCTTCAGDERALLS